MTRCELFALMNVAAYSLIPDMVSQAKKAIDADPSIKLVFLCYPGNLPAH